MRTVKNTTEVNGLENSPTYRQYLEVKAQYPDCIVFFRLGDFLEAFDTDAELVAEILDVEPVAKIVGKGTRVPMCGIIWNDEKSILKVMETTGKKIAIAEMVYEISAEEIAKHAQNNEGGK